MEGQFFELLGNLQCFASPASYGIKPATLARDELVLRRYGLILIGNFVEFGDGLGAESGVNKRFSEAPVFYWLYTFLIVCGAGIVLMPRLPLIKLILFSQVANGALLPFLLVFMLLLVNRKELMGEYTNSKLANVIAWSTSIIIIVLTIAMIWTTSVGQ
jgi:hypothetical protein